MAFYGETLLVPCPTPQTSDQHPRQLFAIAYSTFSMNEDRHLYPQPCRGDKGFNTAIILIILNNKKKKSLFEVGGNI
jgi:hypothetical protein